MNSDFSFFQKTDRPGEQELYLAILEELARTKDLKRAIWFLQDASADAKGQNCANAFCAYLAGFVIPTLQSSSIVEGNMPLWVHEALFEDQAPMPTTVEGWVDAFPGSCIVSFSEAIRGQEPRKHGRMVPDTLNAKKTRHGLFMTSNEVSGVNHLDAEVTKLRFFFLDFDGGDKVAQKKRIEEMPLTPSIIVESANGYHVYYRLRDHAHAADAWSAVEKRMILKEGADVKASNPARVLRMPYTWHCKDENNPYFVKIVWWSNKKYDFEDIEGAYPRPKEPKRFGSDRPLVFNGLKPAPSGVLVKDGRHNGLEEYLKAAYFRINEQQNLARSLREYTKQWYEHGHFPQKPNWEKEVDDYCDFFERRQWGCIVSR